MLNMELTEPIPTDDPNIYLLYGEINFPEPEFYWGTQICWVKQGDRPSETLLSRQSH